MVDSRLLIALFLLLQLFVSAMTTIASANPLSLTNQSTQNSVSNQQFNNIIEALVGAGDFSDWASVLSVTDSSTFPITATLFIPSNQNGKQSPPNLFKTTMNPTILAYHIVPQHLTFSDLRKLPIHSLLPTLLPNKSIEITNNSAPNFTIENSRITHPDVVISGPFAVHGISSMLSHDGFGDGLYEDSSSVVDGIDIVSGDVSLRWFGIWFVLSVSWVSFAIATFDEVFDTHRDA